MAHVYFITHRLAGASVRLVCGPELSLSDTQRQKDPESTD